MHLFRTNYLKKKSLLGTSKISMHLWVWAKNLDKAGPMITDLKKRSICPQIYALVSVSTGRMWLILCSRSPGRRLKPPCVPWGCSPSARRQYPTWRPWMQSENELKCVQEGLLREEQNTSDFSESNRYFPAGFLMFQDQPPAWCGPSLASPSFCSNLIPLSPHIFGQDQIGFGHLANYLLDICRADYLCH